jgi:hypothetical protein
MKTIATKYVQDTLLMGLFCCLSTVSIAQTYDCNFKAPVVTIDFGTADLARDYSFSGVKNYKRANSGCPNDGEYSFVSYTSDCFGGRWHSVLSDHTTGDVNGRMMVVNASEKPGYFFSLAITGLKPGATYQLSAWLMNICIYGSGCYPTPPEIEMGVVANGHLIASFQTGKILQTNMPVWKKYFGEFTLPDATDVITLQMKDLTSGGCGNDFALDDIFISECTLPAPVVTTAEKPKLVVEKPKPEESVMPAPQKTANNTKPQEPVTQVPSKKPVDAPILIQKSRAPIPQVIATRANPVVQQIKTEATELIIELYDNGEIDGDTVSIYHNNELIVNHAGISDKPVTIKIKVDQQQPHHELVMVADNLGSIPPNTSLMIITAGKKRYEIFISSSEQKNAKVVIDLQQ